MTHTKMMLSLFLQIKRSSSSEETNKGYMYSIIHIIQKSHAVTTSEGNMVGFTSRKIERTKLDMKYTIVKGCQLRATFNHMVSTNIISNFPISVEDRSNAE